ncbi:DEAD H (Asp-Glu-Ala-Asp His) box helicase 11 [Actinomortierella ambigua]|nr:DEAD H (Asp-Glu-Ala-Asp His) box helicase 11 [Actinomortierella ambigua]
MICGAVGWLLDHEKRQEQEEDEENEDENDHGKDKTNSDNSDSRKDDKKDDDLPDWVRQHAHVSEAQLLKQEREEKKRLLSERVQRIREREQKLRESLERKQKRAAMQSHQLLGGNGFPRPSGLVKKKKNDPDKEDDSDDAEYLLDEYHSDQESKKTGRRPGADDTRDLSNLSEEVRQLLQSFDEKEAALKPRRTHFGEEEEEEDPGVLKIYYCSRTHSQLTQFIEELRKTSYRNHLHVVSLGSRKTLCINDKMRSMAKARPRATQQQRSPSEQHAINVNKLNDLCLDAQKSGKSSDQRCQLLHRPSSTFDTGSDVDSYSSPYKPAYYDSTTSYGKMDGDEKALEFRDHTLARIRDIEELAELGKELETCPYYGTRQAAKHCQLVTLPYNLLLHASTRESLKLMIKDNVLLLDEAHNLIDSLLQMHSVVLPLDQLTQAQEQLAVYLKRYETRLSSTNEGYVRVLIRILRCLEIFIQKWMAGKMNVPHPSPSPSGSPSASPSPATGAVSMDRVMKVNEFLHEAAMDHINLFKAHAYLQKSGVARKLQGLHESIQRQQERKERRQQQQQEQQRLGAGRGQVKIHGKSEQGWRASTVGTSGAGPKKASVTTKATTTTPVLLTVDSFLMSLLNADNDGRVIVTMEDVQKLPSPGDDDEEEDEHVEVAPSGATTRKPVLKFMLLNPANVFRPLVEEARSVILAGGTMEPVSDLLSHLFPYLREKESPVSSQITTVARPALSSDSSTPASLDFPRIHRFTCGHVIPKDNLLVLVTESSASGMPLELNFANRHQDKVLDTVGQSLINLLRIIPDGVVIFFVSYAYMAQVLARWKVQPPRPALVNGVASPATPCIFDRIQAIKRVFVEPKEASEADQMLREYSDWIHASPPPQPSVRTSSSPLQPLSKSKGAVLFSVVGGKMSEGINFSDRLGRGVIMVGMPYPNKGSPELQERMRYMDLVQAQEEEEAMARPGAPAWMGKADGGQPQRRPKATAGSEYYENLCMRAVNQSIGRAIRHRGDYAVIVLLDKRYGQPRIQKKLPGWIGESLEGCEAFGQVVGKVHRFFKAKQSPS